MKKVKATNLSKKRNRYVRDENGRRFLLTPTKIAEVSGRTAWRFAKRRELKEAVNSPALVELREYARREDGKVSQTRTVEGGHVQARHQFMPDIDAEFVTIGCKTFSGKDAQRLAKWLGL